MSAPQIHPEDLLDRARGGRLVADERRLLERHLARCAACRFELSLAPALFVHVELDSAEIALAARAVAKVRPQLGRARRGASRKHIRAAVLTAAAVMLTAAASGGAYVWRRHAVARIEAPSIARSDRPEEPPSDVRTNGASHRNVPPTPMEMLEPSPVEAFTAPAPVPADRATPEHPPKRDAKRDPSAQLRETTCADRFHGANVARRRGAAEDAVQLYKDLEAACPGTTEEFAARVLLGRVYLDRLSDPARALSSFERYLAGPSGGALREDAMIGRALALGKLNRSAEEAAAWQALLASYPDSLYADKARSRLSRPK
jgi:hypothetical protein